MKIQKYEMVYNKEKNMNTNHLRIFGEDFMKNNSNKMTLVMKNKKIPKNSVLSIENIKENKIKIH